VSNDDSELRHANIALAERVIKTCGSLRPQDVKAEFADDAVLELPYAPAGTPREIVGRDAVIDYISLLADYIPPSIFVGHQFDTLASDPGHVIAWYSANTQLLTTGRDYANTYLTEIKIRDGKVTLYKEFFDPINWLVAQGGEIKPPSGA
jgi:hypothetical protein